MTVNGYTITGDHYFFLNFYQLMDLTSAKKAGSSRLYDFPKFFVGQYEFFHYFELCKISSRWTQSKRHIYFTKIDCTENVLWSPFQKQNHSADGTFDFKRHAFLFAHWRRPPFSGLPSATAVTFSENNTVKAGWSIWKNAKDFGLFLLKIFRYFVSVFSTFFNM